MNKNIFEMKAREYGITPIPEDATVVMAYVPYQSFTSAYDLNYALSVGTIFPQLCKPFCGKRGGFR